MPSKKIYSALEDTGKLHHYRCMSLLLRGLPGPSFAILYALDVSSRGEDLIASESIKTIIRERRTYSHDLPR